MTITKPLFALTAEDVMDRPVVTIPQTTTVKDAAHVLRQENVSRAAVVDEEGRCVGSLSTSDCLRWMDEKEFPEEENVRRQHACPFLTKCHPACGGEGWICVLAPGSCDFQESQPTFAGKHVSICQRPGIDLTEWPRVMPRLPHDSIQRYATLDVATVHPRTPLHDLARKMIGTGIPDVYVTDEKGRPVGVVTSINLLAIMIHNEVDAVVETKEATLVGR